MASILFLAIILGISPQQGLAAAESCGGVFQDSMERQNSTRFAQSRLEQENFAAVKTPEQFESFAKGLIAQKTDPISLVISLWETQLAKDANWRTDDILKFLLNLEVKFNLTLPRTPFPHTDLRFIHTTSIKNRFDIERYVIARMFMSEMPAEINQRLMQSSYVKEKNLSAADVEAITTTAVTRISQLRDWYATRSSQGTDLAKIFSEQSAHLEKIQNKNLSKEVVNDTILKLLAGSDANNPDLRIVWRVNYPEAPVAGAHQYWHLRPAKKITADYVMETNPQQPFTRVNRFLGHPAPDFRFFENVYKNYQDRIRDEIVLKVKEVEARLPEVRQSYGIVFESQTNEAVGTIRVFDGTPRRINDIFSRGRAETSPVLPLEAIFKARNIPVNFINHLEKMRVNDAYTPVFEIGKLSLEGASRVRDRSMKALELFLLQYYLSRYPNGLYLVHVASEPHLKLYEKRYGFKIIETVKIPGTDNVEHILGLSGEEFRTALLKRLGF